MATRVSIRDLPNPFPETEEVYGVTVGNEEIRTVVTKNDSTVESWIEWISNEYDDDYINHPIVGLDVEWKPPFGPHRNPVATLQLCVDRRCLIFQIIHADGVPESLDGFLRDTNYRFVGVGIQSDVDKLGSDYNICVENVFDLRDLAAEKYGRKDLKNAGLMGLAGVVLGRGEIEKPRNVTLSNNWDLYRLTPAQVKYACVDAYVSFKIGEQLLEDDD
ncbi:hypothetical protein MKW98_010964 [Papaver atlanticum]|uniref:3'-5' exonuclease domain-containing protein n=1 Tax=Papaver atlanticum TaxID=357466 RepID=A0AAD4XYY5_9MAGN|nr:hypothetical protein MKW98_010964 [Papaver atlanticum]